MLTQENYWVIKELHTQGMYKKDIAHRLGAARRCGRASDPGVRVRVASALDPADWTMIAKR